MRIIADIKNKVGFLIYDFRRNIMGKPFEGYVICPHCKKVFQEIPFDRGEGHECYLCNRYSPHFESWPPDFIKKFLERLEYVCEEKDEFRELFLILYPSFIKMFLEMTLYRYFASHRSSFKRNFFEIEKAAGGIMELISFRGKDFHTILRDLSPVMYKFIISLETLRAEFIQAIDTEEEDDVMEKFDDELRRIKDLFNRTEELLKDIHNYLMEQRGEIFEKLQKLEKRV
jgi:hypothetical protein